jgi:hypothetical protein
MTKTSIASSPPIVVRLRGMDGDAAINGCQSTSE